MQAWIHDAVRTPRGKGRKDGKADPYGESHQSKADPMDKGSAGPSLNGELGGPEEREKRTDESREQRDLGVHGWAESPARSAPARCGVRRRR